VGNTLQGDCRGGTVDTADRTPIAVPHPYPILMAAHRSGCRMRREGVGSESLDFAKERSPLTPRQRSEILSGRGRHDQLQARIVAAGDCFVNDNCL
jgi:hypothetical protein